MMRMPSTFLLALTLAACANGPASQHVEHIIEIRRDSFGVPHIFADDEQDLAFGYGYVLAEDRLYQMEMLRRSSQGTVAEVLGADYLAFDKQQRALFWPDEIRQQIEAASPEHRAFFKGMADGLNRRIRETIDRQDELLPVEFIDGDFLPAEWTEYDVVMLYVGTMLLRYGNFNSELQNLAFLRDLEAQHGHEQAWLIFNSVLPRQDSASPITVVDELQSQAPLSLKPLESPSTRQPSVVGPTERISGFSNALVVSGSKLSNAESVLINGPQFGWYIPGYTYSFGLHSSERSIVGNAPVGYPFVMFGQNGDIAWGSTWGASDNIDIFELRLNPELPNTYWRNGEWVAFDSRTETISVRDGADVELSLYRSQYGPIVEQTADKTVAYAKKRAWAGRELENLTSWMDITKASNHADWRSAAYRTSINVNLYFASRDGDIAYFAGGSYPERSSDHDNRLPVLGDGSKDWIGFKDPSTNPQVLNPASGYIANWNNKPGLGILNPDLWWYSWTAADRVEILNSLMAASDAHTPDDIWDLMMKASYIDPNARYFLEDFLRALNPDGTAREQEVFTVLTQWDHSFARQSGPGSFNDGDARYSDPAVAIFRTWLLHAMQLTLGDDLSGPTGKALASDLGYGTPDDPTAAGLNITVGLKLLYDAAQGKTEFDFFNGRSKTDIWRDAFDQTISELETTYGPNLSDWQLAVPSTRLRSSNFLGVPQTRASAQSDVWHDMNRGTENNMIVFGDGELIAAYEIAPPGQSGFISPDGQTGAHYSDQVALFAAHGRRELLWEFAASGWHSVKRLAAPDTGIEDG